MSDSFTFMHLTCFYWKRLKLHWRCTLSVHAFPGIGTHDLVAGQDHYATCISIYIYLLFSHLADAFIQSDLHISHIFSVSGVCRVMKRERTENASVKPIQTQHPPQCIMGVRDRAHVIQLNHICVSLPSSYKARHCSCGVCESVCVCVSEWVRECVCVWCVCVCVFSCGLVLPDTHWRFGYRAFLHF